MGYHDTPAVKMVLTYRENAPVGGLSYCELLETVSRNCRESNIQTFVKILVESSLKDLIAYKIEPSDLKKTKEAYSALAHDYLTDIASHASNIHSGIAFLVENTEDNPWHEAVSKITALESSLIVCEKSTYGSRVEKLGALGKYLPDMVTVALYYRLAFARNNDWTNLICCKLPVSNFRLAFSIGFTPMVLPKGKIKALIISSNSALTSDAADDILKRLAARKNWGIQYESPKQ